jgi:hypothetical protein
LSERPYAPPPTPVCLAPSAPNKNRINAEREFRAHRGGGGSSSSSNHAHPHCVEQQNPRSNINAGSIDSQFGNGFCDWDFFWQSRHSGNLKCEIMLDKLEIPVFNEDRRGNSPNPEVK